MSFNVNEHHQSYIQWRSQDFRQGEGARQSKGVPLPRKTDLCVFVCVFNTCMKFSFFPTLK